MIPRDKHGRFCRLLGQHVRVLRLEHVGCISRDSHGPADRHGPATGCTGYLRPPFGWRGGYVRPRGYDGERCGVTAAQVPYWWDDHITPASLPEYWRKWHQDGWAFVAYDVPLEEVREENGQVIFVARDEYRVGEVSLSELPPPIEHPSAVGYWHSQHDGKARHGRALLAGVA